MTEKIYFLRQQLVKNLFLGAQVMNSPLKKVDPAQTILSSMTSHKTPEEGLDKDAAKKGADSLDKNIGAELKKRAELTQGIKADAKAEEQAEVRTAPTLRRGPGR
jgi:hypothetical protein